MPTAHISLSSLTYGMLPYSHSNGYSMIIEETTVRLLWDDGRNNETIWNEICVWAIETFGIPGQRFTWHPTEDYMDFRFKNKHDALVFQLRWS